jgi:hypothetical protein
MTLLLELNDLGVRCYRDGELLHQSPGVAVTHQQLLLGDPAWQQSRLHPQSTYTEFWSQLNTAPISSHHPKVRHHGDLAYLHLQHIESQLPFSLREQDVIYSLPSSTDRNALGLLLGISQQCGLNTIGLVDQALASLLPQAQHSELWHLEMHLNNSVLTRLALVEHQLQRQQFEVLSDQGWLKIHTKALQFISDEFIQKTRFNPRHDANSEQLLFNAIPNWLEQSLAAPQISCEIQGQRIDIDSQSLRQVIGSAVPAVMEKLQSLDNLYLGDRLAQWQPLLAANSSATHLTQAQQVTAMSALSQQISAHPEGVRFITHLPCRQNTDNVVKQVPLADHFLWKHRAYPLSGLYSLDKHGDIIAGEQADALMYLQQGKLRAGKSAISLSPNSQNGSVLVTGDQAHIDGLTEVMTFIEVKR